MLAEMSRSLEFIQKTAKFADDGERNLVLNVYRSTIAAWQKRIDERR